MPQALCRAHSEGDGEERLDIYKTRPAPEQHELLIAVRVDRDLHTFAGQMSGLLV